MPAMLITQEIRDLVGEIEHSAIRESAHVDALFKRLLSVLGERLRDPAVQRRYAAYADDAVSVTEELYPLDADGYALAFDPLEDEAGFWDTWQRHGIVVGKQVVSLDLCRRAVQRMQAIVLQLSGGACDLERPESWNSAPADPQGVSFISRGFFEVYHDALLGELRQALRIYLHHVMIWGRLDLWTSFDRLGVKLPGHAESFALPLHVDQNPRIHPRFKTIQGVLALADCPPERGTFVGVPGSKKYFKEYERFAAERGEYVELPPEAEITAKLKAAAQALPLRAGDLVTWDSRTAHANTENLSAQARYVAYIAAGPARWDDEALVRARREAFKSGAGSNNREALMHASKKSRYTDYEALASVREPEQLTLLGKLLYGHVSYDESYAEIEA